VSRRGLAGLVVMMLAGGSQVAWAASELPLGPKALDERRSSAQLTPAVRWTRISREGGPWLVNVLRVAPTGRVAVTTSADAVGVRARPSTLARRVAGVAAVNGGYFAADGNPAGVLASAGVLLSEPVGGRTALAFGDRERRLAALRFAGAVTVDGETRLLDGVNRRLGMVPACGGRGGDRPTERPAAATICTDPSELVLFTPQWGSRAPAADQHALVRAGVIAGLGRRTIPGDGFVLGATGAAARFLDEVGATGAEAQADLGLRSRGGSVRIEEFAGIVGGGPRLLANGRVRLRAAAEGFAPLSAPWFYRSFVTGRHPRTLAGLRPDGTLLLVTVDGRRPGWSAGATLPEAALLMRALGARDALNLDGGGSSAMTVRGRVVSRPSDPSGERPVSDALVVLP
jgi:Phosphodiester glycosidase